MNTQSSMRLLHLNSHSQEASERGKSLAAEFSPELKTTANLYLKFYTDIGIDEERVEEITTSCFEHIQAWYPELAREIQAIAEYSDVDLKQLMAVTARTEILASIQPKDDGECSTAVLIEPGITSESIQTWDWHDYLVPAALIWQYRSPCGLDVKTFTEFGAPAKIGVNSAGLGVHFNILHHQSDHVSGGVPVHVVARRILDEATSIEQAVAIAESAVLSASTVLTVVTSKGNAVSIEMCPQGIGIIQPTKISETNELLIHTNHFLANDFAKGDTTVSTSTSYRRFDYLNDNLHEWMSGSLPTRITCFSGPEKVQAPIYARPNPSLPIELQWQTLATISLLTSSNEIAISTKVAGDLESGNWTTF